MSIDSDEFERTIACAETAITQIKALKKPAHPRNFELLYAYATAHMPALNQAMNAALAHDGKITQAELDALYDAHLSPTRFFDQIEAVGEKMNDRMSEVRATIAAAAGSSSDYSGDLAAASRRLEASPDLDSLKSVIQSLVLSSTRMAEANERLEAQLRVSSQEISSLQENLEAVRNESFTDPLTNLANRKRFQQALDKAMGEVSARGEPFSLILLDIDHFKRFNDTFGHLTGDQVLRLVAKSLKETIKGQDTAARYGGEEFAVILPYTPLRQATTVAEHMRRAVAANKLMKRSTGQQLGHVTVSIGVATFRPGDAPDALVGRADQCLYAAKANGRNCVVCETDPEVAADHIKVA